MKIVKRVYKGNNSQSLDSHVNRWLKELPEGPEYIVVVELLVLESS